MFLVLPLFGLLSVFVVCSEVNISLKVKLQLNVKILIPPSPWPKGAWAKSIPVHPTQLGKGQGGAGGVLDHWSPEGVERDIIFVLLAKAASQGLGLGLLPWPAPPPPVTSSHQKSHRKTLPVFHLKRVNR